MRLEKYMRSTDYLLSIWRRGPSLWQNLKKDCKPFLKEIKKYKLFWFWRGSEKDVKHYEKFETRKNRRPRDTPLWIHNILNKEFKKKFGWSVRSEGVFASSDKYGLYIYGEENMFFPVGKYKYVWSPKVNDLLSYIKIKKITVNSLFSYKDFFLTVYKKEYGRGAKGYWEYDKKLKFPKTNASYWDAVRWFEQKLQSLGIDHDLIKWVPEKTFEEFVKERKEELESDLELRKRKLIEIVDTFQDTDLKKAFISRNETIFKCDYYYLISEIYSQFLHDMILKGHFISNKAPLGRQIKVIGKEWKFNKEGFPVYYD